MDGNTDYVEMDGDRVKDRKAPVIVFEHTMDSVLKSDASDTTNILLEIMAQVDQKYNYVITDCKEDGNRNIVGFVHPISHQTFVFQENYFERKAVCDKLYQYSKNEVFKWRCQSDAQIINSAIFHLDLGDRKLYMPNYSEEERQLDMNNPISQLIARDDDDKYLALNG
jgi:hypothetical protein